MPDFERVIDDLKIDVANDKGSALGKNADYWEGYKKGKSFARLELAIGFGIICFAILIGGYISN